jgi:hypothetical protein
VHWCQWLHKGCWDSHMHQCCWFHEGHCQVFHVHQQCWFWEAGHHLFSNRSNFDPCYAMKDKKIDMHQNRLGDKHINIWLLMSCLVFSIGNGVRSIDQDSCCMKSSVSHPSLLSSAFLKSMSLITTASSTWSALNLGLLELPPCGLRMKCHIALYSLASL